jgi:hypothetical protein
MDTEVSMRKGLTPDIRKRIARIAFERMEMQCETAFQYLTHFQTLGVCNFLAWVKGMEKPQQLEAALSVTCRQLQLRHIECRNTPNLERWVESYRAFPLNAGLDPQWRPGRHARAIASLVKRHLAPIRILGPRSIELADDNALAIPPIRASIELSTKLADIVVLQFVRGDLGLFDASYVSLLGLGQTGLRVYEAADCEKVTRRLPDIISKVREVIGPP